VLPEKGGGFQKGHVSKKLKKEGPHKKAPQVNLLRGSPKKSQTQLEKEKAM